MISANTIRSNHSIFIPCDTGSPKDDVRANTGVKATASAICIQKGLIGLMLL